MNENKRNRREWVKTVAIIFLTVMLILTFFSNTIMNYSLPEVAAQYIQSGSITAKVRGTGTVESGSLYNVKVSESRKVSSVEVRVGDTVAIGDVICTLADMESDELAAAREELEKAQEAYDMMLLAGNLSVSAMQSGGKSESVSAYKKQLIAAQSAVDEVQTRLDAQEPAYNSAKEAKETADQELSELENKLADVENWMNYQGTVSSGNAAAIDALTKQHNETQQLVYAARNKANLAAADFAAAEKERAALEEEKGKAQDNVTALAAEINSVLSLASLYDAVKDAENRVEELQNKAVGATVKAEIAGTVTSVSVVAGETTSPDTPVAVIQPEGKGYTLSFSVTADQAKRISVGDPAELVNSWWYNDITATVASIKPDPSDPAKSRLITFELSGDLMQGQSLSFQVGQKSSNYDMIVPNSAIREDNNGKFVLVVEAKSSPLGTRYYAVRYDVEVLASDDTQSAIKGALYGGEYVITTSTKPVEAGKLVRLPD